jgi:hypothetical protein
MDHAIRLPGDSDLISEEYQIYGNALKSRIIS